jgi:diguanylate cyclase (GGDEF)-like protein
MALLSWQNARLLTGVRTDSRTGLMNMDAWRDETAAELNRAMRNGTPMAVAIIDIDHFKTVNDTFGHLTGDEALHAVASSLQAHLRRYDRAGRYGGDEFVVLFPDTTSDDAARIAERLCNEIASAPVLAGMPRDTAVTVTVSAGISQLTAPGSGLDELLATADAALYSSKRAGRYRVRVATSTHLGSRCT